LGGPQVGAGGGSSSDVPSADDALGSRKEVSFFVDLWV
jgi:hypothetical protein